jgi:hypothetical protein
MQAFYTRLDQFLVATGLESSSKVLAALKVK